jgi:ABC-2 type transport system permease protein
MNNLIKTEWLKLRNYRAFWWMAGIITVSYPGINYIFYQAFQELRTKDSNTSAMVQMLVGNPFTFPEVWHTVAYFSSIFVFIPAVVVIMFITNEYTYKTHRQNIIDGWSRNQFMASKMIDVLIVSMLATLLYSIVTLVIGNLAPAEGTGGVWAQSRYIVLFALQVFSQLSIAFLIAFLTRKAFVALGIFIFYFIILENIFVGIGKWKEFTGVRFLPLEVSDRLIPPPAFMNRIDEKGYKLAMASINEHIIYTILLTAIIWALCFWINKKRDL